MHTHTDCRVRKKWVRTQEGDDNDATPPESSLADGDTEDKTEVNDSEDDGSNTELTSLLVSTMNLVGDNGVVRGFIVEAINASN